MATATLDLDDRAIRCKATFRVRSVDRQNKTLRDVSLLTGETEAEGWGEYIDQKTIEGASKILMGRSIPAYITHEGAMEGSRLTTEVGLWSGFYIDHEEGQPVLRSRQFKFFPSFQKNETPRMERLLDLAAEMPSEFGVSLVSYRRHVWVLDDGSEIPAKRGETPPPNAIREIPSVRFTAIESGDFTKEPAANPRGLYSAALDEKATDKMTQNIEEQLEATKAEYATFKATAEKAATEAENLKAAYAKDRAAFEKKVSDLTTECDGLKKSLEDEKAAYAKREEETKAAYEKQLGETKAALKQAERMSAFKLGVPPPDFVLDDKTSITTENVWAAYSSIKDAGERTAFYRKHRDTFLKAGRKPGAA